MTSGNKNSKPILSTKRSTAVVDTSSYERSGFASLISTTNAQLKSEGHCLKSREQFFKSVIRCTRPWVLKLATGYDDYQAEVVHENVMRRTHGEKLLSKATRLQFNVAVKGLHALGRTLRQSVASRKAGNHAR